MVEVKFKDDCAVITVVVSPNASSTRLLSIENGALKVAVAAPPERSKANRTLLRFLSKLLNLPKTTLYIRRGEKSKRKEIAIRADRNILLSRLSAL